MTRRGCGVLPAISASTAPGGAHSAFPAHRVDGDLTTTPRAFSAGTQAAPTISALVERIAQRSLDRLTRIHRENTLQRRYSGRCQLSI